MAINDSAVVPLYQQVKDDIRAAIESGKYKTNEKIPPEPELSAEYSVSRITVRRAVEELCAEGYLVKMQGRGTFVSKRQKCCQFYGDLQRKRYGAGCPAAEPSDRAGA